MFGLIVGIISYYISAIFFNSWRTYAFIYFSHLLYDTPIIVIDIFSKMSRLFAWRQWRMICSGSSHLGQTAHDVQWQGSRSDFFDPLSWKSSYQLCFLLVYQLSNSHNWNDERTPFESVIDYKCLWLSLLLSINIVMRYECRSLVDLSPTSHKQMFFIDGSKANI